MKLDKHIKFLLSNIFLLIFEINYYDHKNWILFAILLMLLLFEMVFNYFFGDKKYHNLFIVAYITFIEIQQTISALYIFNQSNEVFLIFSLAHKVTFIGTVNNSKYRVFHFILSFCSSILVIMI